MNGPLSSLRVLDLTSVIMGPYATAILGDLGADIIKVELAAGDVGRQLGPARHQGMSALSLNLLRNKRSIVLDPHSADGRAELRQLIEGADAIVTNLRPASRTRLGLDWPTVHELNPRVVLCTAQAFASESSRGSAPAYDDVIQAVSGTVDIYRRAWGEPRFSPSVVADKVCGLFIVNSVLAALYHVRSGGPGQWVDVPMADTMLTFNLVEHLSGRTFVPSEGDLGWQRTLTPERAPHRAKDGWLCVMPYSNQNWTDFFNAVARQDLAVDPRFGTASQRHAHSGPLQTALAEIIETETVQTWLDMCTRLGVAAEEVLDLDHIGDHPYYRERQLLRNVVHPTEGSYRHVRHPVDYSATPVAEPRPAPNLGVDNGATWSPRSPNRGRDDRSGRGHDRGQHFDDDAEAIVQAFETSATRSACVQGVDDDLYEDMRRWRRHLHAHPELGFQEHETTVFIRSLLDEWGLPYDAPLDTGTVAHVRGEIPGPVLVVRADIDALPIQEDNEVSYASTRPGVMHACGHDGHTAILLGLAKLLSGHRDRLRGEIRLVFQPAEELAPSGAAKLVEAGVLDGAMAVVGLHLRSWLDTGVISLTDGAVLASEDLFDITIVGTGGHAGYPHQTTDVLTIAAGLVSQIQTLTSRRIDPVSPAVVTVGSLHAGDTHNVIPSEARLSGTVRTLSPETRDLIESELVGLADAYAAAHHAKAEVTYHRGNPPTINHTRVVEFVRPAAEAVVGSDRVTALRPGMGSEDFAFYGEKLPSVFAFIGARKETSFPHHHPRFDINEEALAIGLRFIHHIVQRWADPETPVPDLQPTETPGVA